MVGRFGAPANAEIGNMFGTENEVARPELDGLLWLRQTEVFAWRDCSLQILAVCFIDDS